jgi:all-trans-nonaprenyl-diphosphate synthase
LQCGLFYLKKCRGNFRNGRRLFTIISNFRPEMDKLKCFIEQELTFKSLYYQEVLDLPMNKLDWEVCPSLVFALSMGNEVKKKLIFNLALVTQYTYMAHKIHQLASKEELPERDRQYAVLFGDFVLGKVFILLCQDDLQAYAEDFLSLIKTMNEGVVQRWSLRNKRKTLADKELILGKERALITALAARISAGIVGMKGKQIELGKQVGYNLGMAWGGWDESLDVAILIKYLAKAKTSILKLDGSNPEYLRDLYNNFSQYIGLGFSQSIPAEPNRLKPKLRLIAKESKIG